MAHRAHREGEQCGYSDVKDIMRKVEVFKFVEHPCITEVIEVFAQTTSSLS